MAAHATLPTEKLPAAVQRIAAFMAGFSIEATRPSDADIAAMAALGHGTCVYLSAPPNRPVDEAVAAAIRLRAAGFEPVPHLAVRGFTSAVATLGCPQIVKLYMPDSCTIAYSIRQNAKYDAQP